MIPMARSTIRTSRPPYATYTPILRRAAERAFGPEAVEHNLAALNTKVELLRDSLFLTQMEGHCREMLRLIKPEGRIYFSIEMLHSGGASQPYFQAEVSCRAMSIIGRHFYFDLQTLPEIVTPAHAAMVAGGRSLIHSWLLLSKSSRN